MQDEAQATLQAALVVLAQINHVGAAEGVMAALEALGADVAKADADALAFAALREAARESDDWAAMLPMFDAVVALTTASSEHRLHISIQAALTPVHAYLAAAPSPSSRIVMEPSAHMQPYLTPSTPRAVRRHAAAFCEAMTAALNSAASPIVALRAIVQHYNGFAARVNLLRFLNRTEDTQRGVPPTLPTSLPCVPIELLFDRHDEVWQALQSSMTCLPHVTSLTNVAALAAPIPWNGPQDELVGVLHRASEAEILYLQRRHPSASRATLATALDAVKARVKLFQQPDRGLFRKLFYYVLKKDAVGTLETVRGHHDPNTVLVRLLEMHLHDWVLVARQLPAPRLLP
ncbi:hypothetical protein SDRG_05033 [Saprolegnia diclina VS20]|uniref:Uncharacterized protein n=1 Tax=Saprolegnia diclina (strain VS20) TaxID=1156394 RepID=T0QTV7_SAPDV|nr:hypothetical protein SDRG_05033 [Saprolegnia diclina VS20]EQC37430.1 hypothetical protein SDRG_05033 [Saprolegnia diclina VS20]|eukprot:XP_008608950.1 hypothetical protein SDRG_05033 [Saprolegnia diclina VS20]